MECVEIACDESGSEGENLISTQQPIFVHASSDLDSSEAAALIGEARLRTDSDALELKSRLFVGKTRLDRGEWFLDSLAGRGAVGITDKRYFVVGKMVDLLIEPEMESRGEDFYMHGRAHKTAQMLYRLGPTVGIPEWDGLLNSFNRLVQVDRTGTAVGRSDDFFGRVTTIHGSTEKGALRLLFGLILSARVYGDQLEADRTFPAQRFLDMDPLLSGVAQTARHWHTQSSKPIRIIHDNTSALTPQRIQMIVSGLNESHPSLAAYAPPVPLKSISLVDSKSDQRVQVTDILAGIAKDIAQTVLQHRSHPLTAALRPYVDPFSMWEDDESWASLYGT